MVKNAGISRFTEYGSPCLKNEEIKKSIGSESPLAYRLHLQKNADNIMKGNFKDAFKSNSLECKCQACLKTCNVCGKAVNLNKK